MERPPRPGVRKCVHGLENGEGRESHPATGLGGMHDRHPSSRQGRDLVATGPVIFAVRAVDCCCKAISVEVVDGEALDRFVAVLGPALMQQNVQQNVQQNAVER
jgi:hypothetical protein